MILEETIFDIIPFTSEDSWLEQRSKGLGGSEIAAILGLDEYKTALDVFLDKTGRTEESFNADQLDAMDRGHWLEVPLLDWYARETGKTLVHNVDLYVLRDNPICRCTPDGLGILDDEDLLAEAKSTRLFVDEAIPKWFIQGQWNLGITGRSRLCIVWIDGNLKRQFEEFDRDDNLIRYMQNKATAFWNNHIIPGIPPDPVNASDYKKLFPRHQEGKVVEASIEDYDLYHTLIKIIEAKSEIEEKEEQLKDHFKKAMEDAEVMIFGGNPIITWKASEQTRFDTKGFKKFHPELYDLFAKKSPVRKFLLK